MSIGEAVVFAHIKASEGIVNVKFREFNPSANGKLFYVVITGADSEEGFISNFESGVGIEANGTDIKLRCELTVFEADIEIECGHNPEAPDDVVPIGAADFKCGADEFIPAGAPSNEGGGNILNVYAEHEIFHWSIESAYIEAHAPSAKFGNATGYYFYVSTEHEVIGDSFCAGKVECPVLVAKLGYFTIVNSIFRVIEGTIAVIVNKGIAGIVDTIHSKAHSANTEAKVGSVRKSDGAVVVINEIAEAFVVHEGDLGIIYKRESCGVIVSAADIIGGCCECAPHSEWSASNADGKEFACVFAYYGLCVGG